MDCIVKSWLFSTITSALMGVVHSDIPTTQRLLLNTKEQFIGNKESCALILDTEFCTFYQGDLSVTDYCTKMKSMANALNASPSSGASTSAFSTWPHSSPSSALPQTSSHFMLICKSPVQPSLAPLLPVPRLPPTGATTHATTPGGAVAGVGVRQ